MAFTDLDGAGAGAVCALRPEHAGDLAFLEALFRDIRGAQFHNIPGWSAEQIDALLAQQFAIQHRQFRAIAQCSFDIVERAGVPVGRLYVERRERHLHIVDIALVREARRQGIGALLLSTLTASAERDGLGITLEVEHGNPARHLYERFGFVVVSDRGIDLEMERPVSPAPNLG